MGQIYFYLTMLTFNAINWPLVILNMIANMFFAFCLIFPPLEKEGIKQPLNVLLGSSISCTIVYLLSLSTNFCVFVVFLQDTSFDVFYYVTYLVVNYTLNTSMSSSVWLNFFYYTQIVPAQRALSNWVKRNIKYIIYSALFFDRMLYLFDFTVTLFLLVYVPPGTTAYNFNASSNTSNIITTKTYAIYIGMYYAGKVSSCLVLVYMCVCLCVMTVSSFTTVRYLHRHIRSMSGSSSPFSSPRLQSQVRVTITGILQGVFYLFCSVWLLMDTISWNYGSSFSFDLSITYTVVSLYMTGTTVNLAVGQALFRQRAAEVWLKVSQPNSLRLCGS